MRHLTDRQLLDKMKGYARRERAVTLALLLALGEIERRRLHIGLGYSTTFAFLRRHLGYSESGAARRLRVARCFRAYPELVPMFRRREVSLSAVMAISGVLNDSNRVELIAAVKGKSRREVDVLVARGQAPVTVADSIRPVMMPADAHGQSDSGRAFEERVDPVPAPRTAAESTASATPAEAAPLTEASSDAPAEDASASSDASATNAVAGAREMRVVRFAAPPEFAAKLATVRALLSTRLPNGAGLAEVIDAALEAFLEKNDPARRQARREVRRKRKRERVCTPNRSDTIPAAVRDEVYVRDDGRCTYRGSNGVCGSRHKLQIDHVWPRARGGGSEPENLRILCAAHNRQLAREMFPGLAPRSK